MDPISIVIIATVLSLSLALIYLFKSDFERRKKCYFDNSQQSQNHHHHHNHQTNKRDVINNNSKKINKQPNNKSSATTTSTSTSTLNNQCKAPQVPIGPHTSNNNHQANHYQDSNNNTNKGLLEEDIISLAISKQSTLKNSNTNTNSVKHEYEEPPQDELDSSILLGVFNPKLQFSTNNNNNHHLIYTNNTSSGTISKKALKRLRRNADQSPGSYSSDQLFRIIAATNLSRDEIELAVETLLNKIELGEPGTITSSDWKQPKNDQRSLQRLKSQLKELEINLSNETQSHEQTRAKLIDLKNQLQMEKSQSIQVKEDIAKQQKELNLLNLALEQSRIEISQQQLIQKKLREENQQLILKYDQLQGKIQTLMSNLSLKDQDCLKLRKELDEKLNQIRNYDLSQQSLSETIQSLENKLRSMDVQMEQIRSNKQQDDYEACAKITELEIDKSRLEKVLKDRLARLNELSEANNLLENSLNELQLINKRQEDMLTRLRDERNLNEVSMKRTLCEMDKELKELQSKLSLSSGISCSQIGTNGNMEVYHNQNNNNNNNSQPEANVAKDYNLQYDDIVSKANERERKLVAELNQLREGLSVLLPDGIINPVDLKISPDGDWVKQYLGAVRQLSETVQELRGIQGNSNSSSPDDSPKKSLSSPTRSPSILKNGKSSPIGKRVSSPLNGRSSGNSSPSDEKKKVMETKLLEMSECFQKLEQEVKKLEEEKRSLISSSHRSSQSSLLTTDSEESSNNLNIIQQQQQYKQKIKDFSLIRNKLEAQIKFGVDSLKVEQERVRQLKSELATLKNKNNHHETNSKGIIKKEQAEAGEIS